MVCAVINADGFEKSNALADKLCERFPSIVSVMLNVNKKNTNVVLGEKFILCRGRDYIEDILCGKRFRITPQSFYQVNRNGAELLYAKAAELADLAGGETLIGLYCGTGTIGLSTSDKAKNLIGVEIVPSAVECAKVTAEINGVKNAEFYCIDASKTEDILKDRNLSADVVVIDPPRKGTTRELIEYLNRLNVPKVVYVPCDPDTLARDVAIFREYGYDTDRVYPVDMFPRTGHVESLVCLTRQTN
jgi:23S rRNA (uracil1939-C5)-methyltransferase